MEANRTRYLTESEKTLLLFKFNMEDLRCNREGRLSASQDDAFFKDAAFAFLAFFSSGLVLFVFTSLDIVPTSFIFSILIFITFTGIGVVSYGLHMKPAREGIVVSATGTLDVPKGFTGYRAARAFSIGEEAFMINGDVFRVLEMNALYRIYYTPTYKRVLSIERLDLHASEL